MDLQKAHYEVCLPISGKVKGEGEVKGKELEKGAFACITHSGPVGKIAGGLHGDSEVGRGKWVPHRPGQAEKYTSKEGGGGGGSEECLIELQFPVRKG